MDDNTYFIKDRKEIMRYQLFCKIPNTEIINKILNIFGLKGINDNYIFSNYKLERLNIVEKLNEIRLELNEFYMECKQKRFLDNLTLKKSITILRHFLKIIDCKLVSREKYGDGKKYLEYIVKKNNNKKKINFQVSFD